MNWALSKLRHWLDEKGFHGVVLTSEASVAWLFHGRYHIAIATEWSCAAILVTRDSTEAIVNNIEAKRLQDEEGMTVDRVHIHPWQDDALKQKWLSGWLVQSDVVSESDYGKEIQTLRLSFHEDQLSVLMELGNAVASSLYRTVVDLTPDDTEYAAAGKLAMQCMSLGVEPIVNLVSGVKRAPQYRHVLPTQEKLGRYAILSVCGRQKGAMVSATRMVHFGPIDRELYSRYRAVLEVEASLLGASVVGASLGSALQSGVNEYAAQGYPDEWRHHHQGGIGGYLPRELKATLGHDTRFAPMMMVSWNPTISGVKAEDSLLLREEGLVMLTKDDDYPTVSLPGASFRLPDILSL